MRHRPPARLARIEAEGLHPPFAKAGGAHTGTATAGAGFHRRNKEAVRFVETGGLGIEGWAADLEKQAASEKKTIQTFTDQRSGLAAVLFFRIIMENGGPILGITPEDTSIPSSMTNTWPDCSINSSRHDEREEFCLCRVYVAGPRVFFSGAGI